MFQQAKVELQYGASGFALVVQNPDTGSCVIVDRVDADQVKRVFGEEVVEGDA